MFKNILLAADGSAHSVRAAEHSIRLVAGQDEYAITVAYVVDSNTSKYDVLHNKSKMEITKKRKEKIKDVIAVLDNNNANYDIKFLHGYPGDSIVEYANKNNFDCIVIGSRGLNRLQSVVLGGVSHTVAKGATAPVMIVK